MTTRNYLEQHLVNRGFSSRQSDECLNFCIPKIQDGMFSEYKITLDRPATEYPDIVLKTITWVMKPYVFEWINIPQPWFKPVFEELITE